MDHITQATSIARREEVHGLPPRTPHAFDRLCMALAPFPVIESKWHHVRSYPWAGTSIGDTFNALGATNKRPYKPRLGDDIDCDPYVLHRAKDHTDTASRSLSLHLLLGVEQGLDRNIS